MRKREWLHLRISTADSALLRATSRRLDTSVSELVRAAAVEFALEESRRAEKAAVGDQQLAATA